MTKVRERVEGGLRQAGSLAVDMAKELGRHPKQVAATFLLLHGIDVLPEKNHDPNSSTTKGAPQGQIVGMPTGDIQLSADGSTVSANGRGKTGITDHQINGSGGQSIDNTGDSGSAAFDTAKGGIPISSRIAGVKGERRSTGPNTGLIQLLRQQANVTDYGHPQVIEKGKKDSGEISPAGENHDIPSQIAEGISQLSFSNTGFALGGITGCAAQTVTSRVLPTAAGTEQQQRGGQPTRIEQQQGQPTPTITIDPENSDSDLISQLASANPDKLKLDSYDAFISKVKKLGRERFGSKANDIVVYVPLTENFLNLIMSNQVPNILMMDQTNGDAYMLAFDYGDAGIVRVPGKAEGGIWGTASIPGEIPQPTVYIRTGTDQSTGLPLSVARFDTKLGVVYDRSFMPDGTVETAALKGVKANIVAKVREITRSEIPPTTIPVVTPHKGTDDNIYFTLHAIRENNSIDYWQTNSRGEFVQAKAQEGYRYDLDKNGKLRLQVGLDNGNGKVEWHDGGGYFDPEMNEVVPDATPAPKATATATATPAPSPTRTEAPKPTTTPLPLENLGPPVYSYTTANTTEFDNSHYPTEWYKDKWFFKTEVGGNLSVVNTADYPDSASPYAPKNAAIKSILNQDIAPNFMTHVDMTAAGPPVNAPFSVKFSFQVSKNFNNWVANGYNGLLTINNDSPHIGGKTFSQLAAVGLRRNGTLDFGGFFPDDKLNFSRSSNAKIEPDKWYELEVRIDSNAYGYAFVNGKVYAEGQLIIEKGARLVQMHAGAHTMGIQGGGYILNGPVTIESWAKQSSGSLQKQNSHAYAVNNLAERYYLPPTPSGMKLREEDGNYVWVREDGNGDEMVIARFDANANNGRGGMVNQSAYERNRQLPLAV